MKEGQKDKEFTSILYGCMENCCEKLFTTKFNLRRHIETAHKKTTEFTCLTCMKTFASKQNLCEHEYLHTGDKPFKCNDCHKLFRQLSQLSLHKRIHLKPTCGLNTMNFNKGIKERKWKVFNLNRFEEDEEKVQESVDNIVSTFPHLESNIDHLKLPKISENINNKDF
ncbi:unnamed protein product [Blepharisma stoltei]|uniref:C2H2-type domain-containing protein n=1 Tax=Blepharisma stoltei TaxID=1481888 RepID=A0AAU9IKG9_9CILI|nr:unnamed protein product [Blepharisma stoltei]